MTLPDHVPNERYQGHRNLVSKYILTLTVRELEGVCIPQYVSCDDCWQEVYCASEEWGTLFFDITDNPDKYWNELNDTVNN